MLTSEIVKSDPDWQSADAAKRTEMVRAIAQWGEAELPEPEKAKNRALVDQLYQEVDDRGMLTKAASWTGNAIYEGAISIPAGAEAMVETGHGVKNLLGGRVEPSIRRLGAGVYNAMDSIGQRMKSLLPNDDQELRDEALEGFRADIAQRKAPAGFATYLATGQIPKDDRATEEYVNGWANVISTAATKADNRGLPSDHLQSDRSLLHPEQRAKLYDYYTTRDPNVWESFLNRARETQARAFTRQELIDRGAAPPALSPEDTWWETIKKRGQNMQTSPLDMATTLIPVAKGITAARIAATGGKGAMKEIAGAAAIEAAQGSTSAALDDPNAGAGAIAEAGAAEAVGGGAITGAGAAIGKLKQFVTPSREAGPASAVVTGTAGPQATISQTDPGSSPGPAPLLPTEQTLIEPNAPDILPSGTPGTADASLLPPLPGQPTPVEPAAVEPAEMAPAEISNTPQLTAPTPTDPNGTIPETPETLAEQRRRVSSGTMPAMVLPGTTLETLPPELAPREGEPVQAIETEAGVVITRAAEPFTLETPDNATLAKEAERAKAAQKIDELTARGLVGNAGDMTPDMFDPNADQVPLFTQAPAPAPAPVETPSITVRGWNGDPRNLSREEFIQREMERWGTTAEEEGKRYDALATPAPAPAAPPAPAKPPAPPVKVPKLKGVKTIHGRLSTGKISMTMQGVKDGRVSMTEREMIARWGFDAVTKNLDALPVMPRRIGVKPAILENFKNSDLISFILNSAGRMRAPKGDTSVPTFGNKALIHPTHNIVWGGTEDPGTVAQAAFEAGKIADANPQTLYDAIAAASKGTNNDTFDKRIATEEEQFQAFNQATAKGPQAIDASQLTVGSVLNVEGEKVVVKSISTDEDGYIQSVELQDGTKFGRQTISGDETIYVEGADIKPYAELDWEDMAPDEPASIPDQVAAGQLGNVLGYGIPSRPADADRAVVLRNAEGKEVRAVAVNAQTEAQVLAALEAQREPGDTVTVEDPAQTVAERTAQGSPAPSEISNPEISNSPPAPTFPGASSIHEWKTMRASTKMATDERLRASWRDGFAERYVVSTEEAWNQFANDFILEHGPEDAAALYLDDAAWDSRSEDNRLALGMALMLKLDRAALNAEQVGDTEALERLNELQDDVGGTISATLNTAAKVMRASQMWTRMSPEGVLGAFVRQLEETRAEHVQQTLGAPPENVAQQIKDELEAQRDDTTSEALDESLDEQLAALQAIIDQLRAELAKAQAAPQTPQTKVIVKGIKQQLTQQQQRYKTKASRKPTRPGQRKPRVIDPQAIALNWIAKLAKSQSDTQGWNPAQAVAELEALIRAYLKEPTPAPLAPAAEALGVAPADAALLQRLLDTERANIATIARERAMAKLVDTLRPKIASAKTKRAIPRLLAKLLDAETLGGLQRPEFLRAYAEAFEMPQFAREQRKTVAALIRKMKAAPEGYLKQAATQELMAELAKFKGIPATEFLTAYWYANILFGLTTQGINLFGNAILLTLRTLLIGSTHNPKDTWQFVRGIFSGAKRGLSEAKASLTTGSTPYKGELKYTSGQTLELMHTDNPQTWKDKLGNAFSLGRFVFRALSAGDALFYHTAREARAHLMASREARALGSNYADTLAATLNNTPEHFRNAQEQARSELAEVGAPVTPSNIDRRAWEIMEESRPQEVIAESRHYGDLTTYAHKPEGIMGHVAASINYAHGQFAIPSPWGPIRILTPVIPFVNIVANVTSTALDFTPVGIARGAMGRHVHHFGEKNLKEFSTFERGQRIASGLLGTLGTGLLFAWAYGMKDEDDADVPFMIYGMGPSTKDKRDQMPKGWKPYTVKVNGRYYSYAESPLSLVLSVAGNTLDYLRYNPKGRSGYGTGAATYALSTSPQVLVKTGVLSSVNDLFGLLEGDRSWKQLAGRTASGFVPAQGLLKDMAELFHGDKVTDETLAAAILKDIPIVRGYFTKPALNVFGEPTTLEGSQRLPIIKRISVGQGEDKDALWLARNKLWIPGSDKEIVVGSYLTEKAEKALTSEAQREQRTRELGRAYAMILTPEEQYNWHKASGQRIKQAVQRLQRDQLTRPKSPEALQKALNDKVTAARREAMAEVFNLKSRKPGITPPVSAATR